MDWFLFQTGSEVPPAVALSTVVVVLSVTAYVLVWHRRRIEAAKLKVRAPPAFLERDFVCYDDLVDPVVRANHHRFNEHLHQRFQGQRVVKVEGEDGVYLAFTHSACKDAMNDAMSFSSNPFPDNRLVALSTMSKSDHTRVLRYVHGAYGAESVAALKEKLQIIVERCTDELETFEVGDAVRWAQRTHMASTLARLGLVWVPGIEGSTKRSWTEIDELVMLNDTVIKLVAPLGGIGRKNSEVSWIMYPRVLVGMLFSIPATLLMAWRLGVPTTWEIIRPDVTVLRPPKSPRAGIWWHPELLPLIPWYFMGLHKLMMDVPSDPEGGPLSRIRAGVESKDLLMAEALTLIVQLMVNMTSANALLNMVRRLDTEKAAAAEVAADPGAKADAFIQEVLRLDAPLQRNPRRVVRAPGSKWKDTPLQPGDQLLLFIGAGNMDPAVFDKPSQFRLDREIKLGTGLSFGSGMHYCLGSNLVHLEMKLALGCLLKRYHRVEVLPGARRVTDVDVGNFGFVRLVVKLHKNAGAQAEGNATGALVEADCKKAEDLAAGGDEPAAEAVGLKGPAQKKED